MEITLDLSYPYALLSRLAESVDYPTLVVGEVLFTAGLYACVYSLELSAGKKIRFSFFAVFLTVFYGAAAFALAYVDHAENARVFDSIYLVALYAASAFLSSFAAYLAVFKICLPQRDGENSVKICAREDRISPVARIREEIVPVPVYDVKTSSRPINEDFKVDFAGVYDYLDALGGENASKAKELKEKIGFYDGLALDNNTLKTVNELFAEAIKLGTEA